nr:hypothetical protein [Tanacetum cinerariifolium]
MERRALLMLSGVVWTVQEVSTEAPIVEVVGTQEFSVEDVVIEDYVSSREDGEDAEHGNGREDESAHTDGYSGEDGKDAEHGNGQKDESAPTNGQFFYDDEGIYTAYETEYDVQSSEDAVLVDHMGWKLRHRQWTGTTEQLIEELESTYDNASNMFLIQIHHGGKFLSYPGRMYVNGRVDIFDKIDIDLFIVVALNIMVLKLGYTGESDPMFYNYLRPLTSLDVGLYALACEENVRSLATLVRSFKLIEVYIEHGVTILDSYLRAPRFRATLEDIIDEPAEVSTQEPIVAEVSTQEPIVAEVSTEAPIVEEVETQEFSVEDVVIEDYVSSREDGEDAEQGNGREDESAHTDG